MLFLEILLMVDLIFEDTIAIVTTPDTRDLNSSASSPSLISNYW